MPTGPTKQVEDDPALLAYFRDILDRYQSVIRTQDAKIRWLERLVAVAREEQYRRTVQEGGTVIWLEAWGPRR